MSPSGDRIRAMRPLLALATLTTCFFSSQAVSWQSRFGNHGPSKSGFQPIVEIDHQISSFTQGLVYHKDGYFIEGTGLYGQSQLQKVNATTGKVMQYKTLDAQYFGEGVATIDDERIVQLTWEEKTAFVYDFKTLELIESFRYKSKDRNGKTMHEGWGITYDGKDTLIVSDGSNTLFFWDKNTYEELRAIEVLDNQDRPVDRLNELEYAKGYIWANIWLTDEIAQIDPADGRVVAFYDLANLYPHLYRMNRDQVLNGIAYDEENDIFYLTGKQWPKYYKVDLCKQNSCIVKRNE